MIVSFIIVLGDGISMIYKLKKNIIKIAKNSKVI